jgi:hypothetical protein
VVRGWERRFGIGTGRGILGEVQAWVPRLRGMLRYFSRALYMFFFYLSN